MKKVSILALVCFLVLTIAGCSSDISEEYPWRITKSKLNIKNKNHDFSMQLSAGSLTSTGARLTVYNHSDAEITFGVKYFIQLHRNGSWYDIDVGVLDWPAELFIADPGSECEMEVDWSSIYGALPAGTYRIVKEFDQSGQSFFLFTVFELK